MIFLVMDCPMCDKHLGFNGEPESTTAGGIVGPGERDNNRHSFAMECPNGHKYKAVIQHPDKFV